MVVVDINMVVVVLAMATVISASLKALVEAWTMGQEWVILVGVDINMVVVDINMVVVEAINMVVVDINMVVVDMVVVLAVVTVVLPN
ncbi:hypothetical protein DFH28DRAFT_951845 [Melampsora americana]|nr:hypothetical protein DFH28DRAFT_951845 [Melampsora americana]